MKNLVKLFPLLIVFVFVMSVYSLVGSRQSVNSEYLTLLSQARDYSESGLLVDALSVYQDALESQPSIDIALEVGEMYLSNDEAKTASSWGTKVLLSDYPTDSESYAFVIKVAISLENYSLAFSTYQTCEDRGLMTDEIDALMVDIWYVYDLSGSFDEVGTYSSTGLAAVSKNGVWGYVDTSGQKEIDYQYESAGVFSGGLAPVIDETGEAYYIDSSGNKKFVSSYVLSDDDGLLIQEFSMVLNNIAVGYDGTSWNYYNIETREQFLSGYQGATVFNGGVAAVTTDGSSWMLINTSGEQVDSDTYQSVLVDATNTACRSEALIVQMDGSYYLINRSGEKISGTAYQDACAFNGSSYAAVQKNGSWIFVDVNGVEQAFGEYEQAQSFSNGLAAVMIDGLWGYIDTTGTLVIPAVFDDVTVLSSFGTSFVKEAGEEDWSLLRLIASSY